MTDFRTCVIQEFPIPDREYRAAPPGQWDRPPRRRAAARKRQSRLMPLVLAGLVLFAAGFLLGRAGAVGTPSLPAAPAGGAAAGSPPVQVWRGNPFRWGRPFRRGRGLRWVEPDSGQRGPPPAGGFLNSEADPAAEQPRH